jgi:hypothetical protein
MMHVEAVRRWFSLEEHCRIESSPFSIRGTSILILISVGWAGFNLLDLVIAALPGYLTTNALVPVRSINSSHINITQSLLIFSSNNLKVT